jgi:tetratricopeptide (TPR) repeat protein
MAKKDDELTPRQKELAALMRRAGNLKREGDIAGARSLYETVRVRAPSLPEPVIMLGILKRNENEHAAAIQLFTEAFPLEVEGHRGRVLNLRAKSFIALGRLDDAMKDVDAALAQDGGEPDSRLLRARILMMVGRLDEARAIVEALLAFQEHPEALGLRAECSDLLGDHQGAARDRARAEEIVSAPGGNFARFWKPRA